MRVVSWLLLFSMSGVAGAQSLPLAAPLNTNPPGYSYIPYVTSPSLTIKTGEINATLVDALDTLDGRGKMDRADAADLTASALRAADENKDLNVYLENLMGFGAVKIEQFVADAAPRDLRQRAAKAKADATTKAARVAVGVVGVGVGAVGLVAALPLALTGVGLIPALAIAGVSEGFMSAGANLLTAATSQYRVAIEKAMPDAMVALLGAAQSEPGADVSWANLSYRPSEQLVKRLNRATLTKKAIDSFGTIELQKPSANEDATFRLAQTLYARDLTIGQIMLSVLSRQVHQADYLSLPAGLIAALNDTELAHLALMTANVLQNPDVFLGLPGYRSGADREVRTKELLYLTYWFKSALVQRARATDSPSAKDVQNAVKNVFGPNIDFDRFDARDVARRVAEDAERAPEPTGPKAKVRARLNDFLRKIRN